MAVLTANCDRAFVIASDKSSEFLNYKTDNKTKAKTSEMLSKISSKVKREQ